MTDGCRVECLTLEAAAAHAPAWADLDARCLEPSVFNTPEFALPAARFIPGARPRVLLVWDAAGRLIGLCLLARPLPGWPARGWLHPQSVAAFPLLDRDEAVRALAAMLRWASRRLQPGLLLQGLPAEGATAGLIAAGGWTQAVIAARPRAVLPGGRGATGLTGKAAKELRRQARRLAEQGTIALRSSHTPDAVAADLEAFLALEAAGWKGRRGTALGRSPGLARFVRTMARGLAEGGQCRIDRLDRNGRPLAMGIVLRCGPTAFFWKTAFDEAEARYSPGVHLTEALSRLQAGEPGLALTDSCAVPDHAMIDRLWPDRMIVRDVIVGAPGQGAVVAAFAQAEVLRRRLRQRLKAVLGRAARGTQRHSHHASVNCGGIAAPPAAIRALANSPAPCANASPSLVRLRPVWYATAVFRDAAVIETAADL